MYIILGLVIAFYFFRGLKNIFFAKNKLIVAKFYFITIFKFLLAFFIVFKLLWGLNYSRQGITKQLNLQEDEYCKEELIELTENLILEANFYRKQIADTGLPILNIDTVFDQTKKAYQLICIKYPFLQTKKISLKKSLYSFAGNYFGFTGYYNPFTGEAQVRSDIPTILLPFIACHEVAHQLGYASEEEANFVAYLVAKNTNNVYLKYATCLELIDYASNELFNKYVEDFEAEKGITKLLQLRDCMDNRVKKDRKEIRLFFLENKKSVANISTNWYDSYLKINYQSNGIASYNKVISLIFAYFKK